jgi:hypothetical protein
VSDGPSAARIGAQTTTGGVVVVADSSAIGSSSALPDRRLGSPPASTKIHGTRPKPLPAGELAHEAEGAAVDGKRQLTPRNATSSWSQPNSSVEQLADDVQVAGVQSWADCARRLKDVV